MLYRARTRKLFVVNCKQCRRDVPTGSKEFPFRSITVECRLCGERHQYRPSEIFLGKPNPPSAQQSRT